MQIVVAAAAILLPLLIAPGFSFYYDVIPKAVVLLCLTAAALLLVARDPGMLRGLFDSPRRRWFTLLAALAMAALALSTAFSTDPSLAWYGSNWRRLGALTQCAALLLALIACAAFRANPGSIAAYLRATTIAGIAAAVYGIAQYFGWDPLLPAAGYEAGEGPFRIVRPPGTLGHSIYFAAWLLYPVFAGVSIALTDSRRRWRWTGLCASVTGAVAILLSGSRGGLAALGAGVLCLVCLLGVPSPRLIGLVAASLSIVGIAVLLSPAGQRLRARVHWAREEPVGGARPLLWRDSLVMAAAKPLGGFGPEVFSARFPKFQSVELARLYPDFYHESPHNAWLDALISLGVPGAALIIAIVIVAVRTGISEYSARAGPIAVALLATLCAGVVAQQFAVFTIATLVAFLLSAAGLMALAPGEAKPSRVMTPHWAIAGAACLVAIYPAYAGFRIGAADHGLVEMARNGPTCPMTITPYAGVDADLYFSRRLLTQGATQSAAECAARATRNSEQPQNAWFNFAVVAGTQNNAVAAEQALRTVIAYAPNWFKPHWALARLLARLSRRAEAKSEAELAILLNGGRNPEVTETLSPILRSAGAAP